MATIEKTVITIENRVNGKTTKVKASKTPGFHLYQISAKQFDRVRAALGHGPIWCKNGRVDSIKPSGAVHAFIDADNAFFE